MKFKSSILFALCLTTPWSALACKYSVRDVGFVDLGDQPYRLVLFVDGTVPRETSETLRKTASAAFLEANVDFELADLSSNPDHPLAQVTASLGLKEFPAAALVSGDQSLPLALDALQKKPIEEAAWDVLEQAVSSPTRQSLLERLIPAYAVILLVEGTDATQNSKAHQAATKAIESITPLIPKMPKPVDVPPELVVIGEKQKTSEAVLLWSLGLDHKSVPEPQAVVMMGRGRRIGPTFQGGLITQTALQDSLAVIGQDCECGLDRSWMQGKIIPARWDRSLQETAYKTLGFDAENPLIKAEMSRILSRGPGFRQSSSSPAATGTFDSLFLGYSEEVIETEPIPPVTTSSPLATELEPPMPPPTVPISAPDKDKQETRQPPNPTVSEPQTRPQSLAEVSTSGVNPILWTLLGLGALALLGGSWLALRNTGR